MSTTRPPARVSTVERVRDFAARRGWRSLLARCMAELRWPTTPLGRRLNPSLRAFGLALERVRAMAFPFGNLGDGDTLYAYYDLSVQPVTADVVWFACAAEQARRRRGLSHLAFVLVPGEADATVESETYNSIVNSGSRRQRIVDLVVPAFRLLPECRGVILAPSRGFAAALRRRDGGRRFPDRYLVGMPVAPGPYPETDNSFAPAALAAAKAGEDLAFLITPDVMRRRARDWLRRDGDERPAITITLRNYGYDPQRNSRIADWQKLAEALGDRGYRIVVVPDTESAAAEIPSFGAQAAVCVEAAWNLSFRSGLYEEAVLNLGTHSGAMAFCYFNSQVRYIAFKMVVAGLPHCSVEHQEKFGYVGGQSLSFAGPHQKFVWDDDRFDVMLPETLAMLEKIRNVAA